MISQTEPEQLGLLREEKTIGQRFLEWKQLPGAGKVIAEFYRRAARYHRRFLRWGVGVSQRYIEEQVRDAIKLGQLRGVAEHGYTLNSHFTKPILEHMLAHHPEWRAMFEVRDGVKPRYQETVIVKKRLIV